MEENYSKDQQELDRSIKRFKFWYYGFFIVFALASAWFTAPDIDAFYDRLKYTALIIFAVYAALQYFDARFKRVEEKVDAVARGARR